MKRGKIFLSIVAGLLALSVISCMGVLDQGKTNPNGGGVPGRALNNGLALTPPMGWNSWNVFKGNINETQIKQIADAMVSSGMRDAGYVYVNLDDNWMANPARDGSGKLIPDPTRFPSGMKALGDYIHSKGLKFGIYGCRGTMTCMNIPQSGSYMKETTDAATYASWGVDYLKYDNCNFVTPENKQGDYERMRDALANSGRAIVYNICGWEFKPWMQKAGNSWRVYDDIEDNWGRMTAILDANAPLAPYAAPGGWNDPDMLEVGNGGMSSTEYQTHFALWSIMAAPLITGNDLRSMSQATKDILLNNEVIAVDQDSLGVQGVRIWSSNGQEIFVKPLADGSRAVVLLNRNSSSANMTVNWTSSGSVSVRDIVAKASRGSFTGSYTVNVASHGVAMLKLVGAGEVTPPLPPAGTADYEAENGIVLGKAVVNSASWASGGKFVGNIGGDTTLLNGRVSIPVNMASAGVYTMTVTYAVSGTRTVFVTVNNGGFVGLNCSGSSFSSAATASMSVTLNAGYNLIKFDNGSGSWAPDLDKIHLEPATGVVFYQDSNYGGLATSRMAKGDYPVLPPGVPNDWMSSLKVPSGWTVDVYADGGFGGTKWTFGADNPWIGSAANDKMSSFRIY